MLDGGKYYAYGTRDDNGIRCYSSDDLRSWKYEGLALHKNNTTENIFFWAPEVYHLGDKYYMYYSANQRLFVATGDSPKGPFKQVGGYQMQDLRGDENCIDSLPSHSVATRRLSARLLYREQTNLWKFTLQKAFAEQNLSMD